MFAVLLAASVDSAYAQTTPTIQPITVNGTSGETVSVNLDVTPTDFAPFSFGSIANQPISMAGGTVTLTNRSDPTTLVIVLPTVTESTEFTGLFTLFYRDGSNNPVLTQVAYTITVNPAPPDPPTISDIAVTGTGGTSETHVLQVSNVTSGYSFLSATPDSDLSTANVTASGTESSGTVTISFGLPSVGTSTTITGNLDVIYSDGTDNLDVAVPVTLTINPPDPPTVTNITATGTENTTISETITVTNVPAGYSFTNATADSTLTSAGVTISGTESGGTISVDIGLPSAQATAITGNIVVTYGDGTNTLISNSAVSLTVNPPDPPTISDITATGTAGTSISHILQVSDVPDGYSFDSAAPDSTLSTANVTASGEESGGTVTVTFGLPSVGSSTEITGNLDVIYSDGTDNLDVAVPVTLTVNPPDPPTVTNITATGIENTTITQTIAVTNIPTGYAFTSVTRDSALTNAGVSISGTESNGTISVDIGLPSAQATAITGNIVVSYGDGTNTLTSNSAVSLTVNPVIIDPPTISDITVTGTGGTSETHILQVSDVPDGYTFDSAAPDSDLTDESVTASGEESGGTVTITFGLPETRTTTTITGNLDVTYTDGTDDLDVAVPVTLTVNPVPSPVFQNITVNGTGGTTVNANLGVTPTDFTVTGVTNSRGTEFNLAGGTVSTTSLSDPITIAFGLPSVSTTTTYTETLIVSYQLNGAGFGPAVTATITVNPDSTIPTPPTIQNIAVTGTGGTSISHTLQVSNVPDGYSFLSATPASNLSDDNVTASGTDSSGTVTISFGLPSVGSSTTITGDLSVRYSNGTTNLDVTVPVTLTVNPPDPPTVTNITATGIENTTITQTITVSNVPAGYTYTSIAPDSALTAAGVSISGTESNGTITVSIDLPSAQASITGNIIVSYGDGTNTITSNSAVSLTIETVDPPTIQNITATGTGGTSITHDLQVSGVPSGYSFLSATPASNLSDDNVTASGTESGGAVTISFGLPSVSTTATITGDLSVRYSDGTTNLDVTVPVTLTVNPPAPPTVTTITATGTENTTISETITVTNVPTGYTYTSIAADSTLTSAGVTISGTESNGTITVSIGLPSAQASPITGNIVVSYGGLTSNSAVSLTVNAATPTPPSTPPSTVTPPTIQNITATGTGGTSISHTLQVSNVPSGYSFLSVTPNSPIINVSGTESGGTVTLSFVLPTVNNSHTLTGNLNIRYSNGTDNLDVTVPISLTINLPDPPTVTNITATGTENTTITETITVSNVPSGYIYTSIAADSTLTAAGVSISGTESGGEITVNIGLPSAQTITGNIIVSYGDGSTTLTSNSAVSLTVETVDPPTISDITATGTGGTPISHTLQVSDVPSGYSFVSATPASNLSDDNVTASGTDSGGTVTISFGLPEVRTSTTITGNLDVRYSDGTDNLDVAVPVTLTVNPVPLPVFQDIAVTGTSGSTVNANIPVTPSDFTVTSVSGTRSSTFTQAGGTVSTTSLSNPITLAFVLPTVTQTTELTETLNISYRLNGAGFAPTVTATITVNPVTPDLPTIQDITATGTGGTSIPYNLQVTNVPSGYNFVSTTPDSTLSTASVTASGAESNGAVTVTFGLPAVNSSTEITGNLNVRYSDGTTNLDVTVPVSLTVNPPAPPTVTDITATGTANTTITQTITVSNVPAGYTYTNITADSALTTAGVSISGTESNGTITVSIGLPSTQASITGNIVVSYGDGTNTLTSNSAVSLTVNPVPTVPPTTPPTVPPTTPPTVPPTTPPTVPPTIQDITVTGTGGTSISHNLQVSNIPSDYSFVSIQPATNFEDVTIAGTESNRVIIITFDLPDVDEFTIITGDLLVRYLDDVGDSQQFTVPVTIEINPERSGGSSDDHKKAPTFGVSLETDTQLVTGGFSFNGIILDITDNWHTDFNRTSSIIGDTNIVTIKGHAPDGFRQVILSLGVPEVGMVNNADTAIILNLERNNETGLEISEILYSQSEEGLVDETRTMASVQKASCSLLDNNQQCYEFTIEFTVMAPLLDDVLTISAMDEKRRITHTYINDGVEFAGESQLPASTDRFIQKVASQDSGRFIELTQHDRRYNVWEDQDGYLWERNSADTWMRLTYPGLELMPDDPSMSIKTRLHSDFARIIQMEQDRATLVFDSALIQNEMDDSSIYNLPAYMPEHLDPVLLENMELEEILALEKMLNRHIYEDSWD